LPLLLSIVAVVMMAQSMNMQEIILAQGAYEVAGAFPIPYLFPQIIAFGVFIVAAQAELSQAPFDMPFAESELVSGFATEYTGFRYLFFFVAEFASNFAMAAIGAVLFLGGWWLPGVPDSVLNVIGPFVLAAKIGFLVFVFLWMRSTFPRLREDQLQRFAWMWLIPISLANIALTGVLKVVL
jgi:NADH-quinone oxidoreductase subunit H